MPYLQYAGLAIAAYAIVGNRWRHRSAHQVALVLFAAAAMTLLLLRSTGRGTPFGDFDKAYFAAGRLALTDPARLYDCASSDGLCFVNIPVVALAFAPISSLPRPAAHAVFAALGVAAIAWAVFLLWQLADARGPSARDAIFALVLLNGPLYYSVRLGNLTHVVLPLLALAILKLVRARDGAAGVLLGVAAILKPPLLVWFAYFALRRHWRAAAAMAAAIGSILAVSIALFGPDLHLAWARQYVAGAAAKPVGAYNVQSIGGFLVRLSRGGTLVNWHALDVSRTLYVALAALDVAVVTAAVLGGAAAGHGRTRAAVLTDCALVLCAMLAISPISWTHYYCLLLIPLAATVTHSLRMPRGRLWAAAVATAGVLVSLPVMLWIPSSPLAGAIVARILLSHYLFGGLLLLSTVVAGAVALRIAEHPDAAAAPAMRRTA